MKQRITAAFAALLVLTAAVPMPAAAIAHSDSVEGTFVKYNAGGNLQPSYVVEYDNGTFSSLENWATSANNRRIISHDKTANQAVVVAPRWRITGSLWDKLSASDLLTALTSGDSLSGKSYVSDISPNYEMSYPDPVNSLLNVSDYSAPQIGITDINDPNFAKSGIAFESEANQTTMAESRDYLGVDNTSATGENITVAVVDTGANTAKGRVFGNGTAGSTIRISNASASFIGPNVTTVNETGWDAIEDGNGHGTWTASAIAANTTDSTHDGIAPDSELLVLKALDSEGSGSTADIAHSIRYAADHDADVISMSLGSPVYSEELADAVQYALDNGVSAVVVATGNSRQTIRWVATPADVNGVIGVGATNGETPKNAQSAYFSQIGPDPGTTDGSNGASQGASVDVVAPGMKTTARVATQDGFAENSTLSGTSMATPMVAGGIALMLDANPTLKGDAQAVRDRALKTARPVPNAAKTEVGHGMFAADNAVAGTEPPSEQADAMDTDAQTRNTFYESLSAGSGGLLPLQLDVSSVASFAGAAA